MKKQDLSDELLRLFTQTNDLMLRVEVLGGACDDDQHMYEEIAHNLYQARRYVLDANVVMMKPKEKSNATN